MIQFDFVSDLANGRDQQPHFTQPAIPPSAVRTERRQSFPRFYVKYVQNTARTKEAGTPQFDAVEMVDIMIAGDAKSSPTLKVSDKIKQDYADEYLRWKNSAENTVDGMPITEMPGLTGGQVAVLRAMNIHSVEQLAGIADSHLSAIGMGARELRAKAQGYLRISKDNAAAMEQAAENQRLKDQISLLTQQMSDVQRRVDQTSLTATATGMPPQTVGLAQAMPMPQFQQPNPWVQTQFVNSFPASPAMPPPPVSASHPHGAGMPPAPPPSAQGATTDAPKRKGGWPKGKPRGKAASTTQTE